MIETFLHPDLPRVHASSASPCLTDNLCPRATKQGLVACDVGTDSCVCERGYTMRGGICVGQSSL